MSEHRLRQNHSSDLKSLTRVNTQKNKPKKTVGITLPPYLIAKARKRNLNISRITEEALLSILEYLQPQNETESSKSFGEAFLPRKGSWGP